MTHKTLLTIIISVCIIQIATANIYSRKFNSDNGLPDNNVRVVAQDKKGFMWFGTPDGLYRFDGYFYTTYKHTPTGHTSQLRDNHITALRMWNDNMMVIRMRGNIYAIFSTVTNSFIELPIDRKEFNKFDIKNNDLWLWSSTNGCSKVSLRDGKLHCTNYSQEEGNISSNNIRFIDVDSYGNIWAATENALYKYNNEKDCFSKAFSRGAVSMVEANNMLFFVCKDGSILINDKTVRQYATVANCHSDIRQATVAGDRLILLSEGTTMEYCLKTNKSSVCKDIQAPGGSIISDNLGNNAIIDTKGWLWFLGNKGKKIVMLKVYNETLMRKIPSPKYKIITSLKDSIIWVSTNGNGITQYDIRKGQEKHIGASNRYDSPISTDYILDICLDKDGNLWVADEFHGVACLTMPRHHIDNIQINPQQPRSHDNQINILKNIGGEHASVLISNTNGDLFIAPVDNLKMMRKERSGIDARTACLDSDGKLWIGTRQQGINVEDKWLRNDRSDSCSISADNIRFLMCDNIGQMWIATEYENVDIATRGSNGTFKVRHLPLREGRVIMQSRDGDIWIGTSRGLFKTDYEGSRIEKITFSNEGIKYMNVNCLYEDSKERLWVGTMGHGVYYASINNKDAKWEKLAGVISNEVQSITEDDGGNVWIGTKKGMTCYNHDKGKISYWYDNNEMLHNYYVENCVSALGNGKLAFGTHSGIVVYETNALRSGDEKKRDIYITEILVNGNVDIGHTDKEGRWILAHDENSLNVRWSVFDYTAGSGVRYSYMLENYDHGWSEPSEYSFAVYKNLPPGKYALRIRAYDNSSAEADEVRTEIVIRHAWWQTGWAVAVYLFIALLIGYIVVRQVKTVYELRRRVSIERELTEYKLKFFTNISHEFRTPLTIIRGAMDRIRAVGDSVPGNMKQPLSNMGRSVDRMMRLVNQLMEFRRMQSGKLTLKVEETEVVEFIRNIGMSFLDVAERKNISYTFLPKTKTHNAMVDRSHLDKIVYNLLSNAFKYTPSGGNVKMRMWVAIKNHNGRETEMMTVSVEDTGVGIDKKKQHELYERFMNSSFANDSVGIGLNLTKELVTTHKGHISFKENKPQGSIFTLEVPISREAYDAEDIITHPSITESPSVFITPTEYKEMGGVPMNNITILVVEDDADISNFLKNELGKYFIIRTAADGNEALTMIESEKPEIVVTDLMMPGMNGMQLAQRLKQDRSTAEIPVVLLTAENDDTQRVKAADNGVDAYITKPFDMRLLIATCKSLLKKKLALAHHLEMNADSSMSAEGEQNLQQTTYHSIITSEADKKFLNMLNNYITQHLSDEQLNVDMLAQKMEYSRTLFYKKVKELLGVSPADYIRRRRMEKAADLLQNEKLSIKEVASRVGICDAHYFTKLFKSHYGITPKKYQKDF